MGLAGSGVGERREDPNRGPIREGGGGIGLGAQTIRGKNGSGSYCGLCKFSGYSRRGEEGVMRDWLSRRRLSAIHGLGISLGSALAICGHSGLAFLAIFSSVLISALMADWPII